MIEVRIRHEDVAKSLYLMHWDSTDLDAVIPLIKSWGLRFADVGTEYGVEGEMTGSFVIADGKAAFEVLVTDD